MQYFGYDFYSSVEQIRLKFGNNNKQAIFPPPPSTQLYDLIKAMRYCPLTEWIDYDFPTVQEHFE